MENHQQTTLERIHRAGETEFLEKGFKSASLRRIVRSLGMTTGAFYGYYESKEALFEALAGAQYTFMVQRILDCQEELRTLPPGTEAGRMEEVSRACMLDILRYAYDHLESCKLLLCCAEGTRYGNFLDELVELEMERTRICQSRLRLEGHPSPDVDPQLEHMLVTGMFNTFFELVIHRMPREDAERYLAQMQTFYFAGWSGLLKLPSTPQSCTPPVTD